MLFRSDFLIFIRALIADYKKNSAEWENRTVDSYLEGMEGWIESMEGYYRNNNITNVDLSNVSWRVFADILTSASIYE